MKRLMVVFMILALAFIGCGGGAGGDLSEPSNSVTVNPVNPNDVDHDGDGYSKNQGDCNDNDAKIYPRAKEICGDGIDQDCDGSDLKCDVVTDPKDVDNDKDGFTPKQGDCNDNDAKIYPGAKEICGDDIDQDCDGSDLKCGVPVTDPKDVDNDKDGFTPNQGDCNDKDPKINPKSVEICGDGIDQDCNGSDLACSSPTTADNVENFADDYEQSMNEGNLDLYMSRVSRNCLQNGQNYSCYNQQREWAFKNYEYKSTSYIINKVSYETQGEKKYATLNRTLNYTQRSKASSKETAGGNTEDVSLVLEDGKWKFFGNQNAYSLPSLSQMVMCEDVNATTGELIGVKNVFTKADQKITVFIKVDSAQNGSNFSIRVFKPDGSMLSESPYNVNFGDYPNCIRFSTNWSHTFSIVNYEGISGYEDYWKQNVGTWRVEISSADLGLLGKITFEYQYK